MLRPSVVLMLVVVAAVASACAEGGGPAGTASSASPAGARPSPAGGGPSPTGSEEPTGVDLSSVPTACIGLGADDCRRVAAQVGSMVPAGTAATYLQVGPFGCPDAQGCATSLVARPEGDVTLEAGVGALAYRVRASAGGADLTIERQDAFGVRVGPSSRPPVTAGARPFALGHCGLWSGIDVGGSWWDPVGPVDADHGDAINAAEGTLAIVDPDHATFTSRGGFTVQLLRRDGEKYLPLCQ